MNGKKGFVLITLADVAKKTLDATLIASHAERNKMIEAVDLIMKAHTILLDTNL